LLSKSFAYLLDGLLSFFNFAELNVAKAKELVHSRDGHLAAEDLPKSAKLCIEILVVPVGFLESFDEDGGALDVSAAWLSSDGVHVVRENSAHATCLDPGMPVLEHGFLCILNAIEHHEGIIEVLE